MSVTRILCDECGFPLAWCSCNPANAEKQVEYEEKITEILKKHEGKKATPQLMMEVKKELEKFLDGEHNETT